MPRQRWKYRPQVRFFAVLLIALVFLPIARADGDPASDILYFTDIFTPYELTSKPLITKLQRATDVARARGRPIKVAVVWTQTDMGAVRDLFNKPVTYAKFLAAELRGVLTGPLLIVMPAGFGLYIEHHETEEGHTSAGEGAVSREDGGAVDRDSDIRGASAPVILRPAERRWARSESAGDCDEHAAREDGQAALPGRRQQS